MSLSPYSWPIASSSRGSAILVIEACEKRAAGSLTITVKSVLTGLHLAKIKMTT